MKNIYNMSYDDEEVAQWMHFAMRWSHIVHSSALCKSLLDTFRQSSTIIYRGGSICFFLSFYLICLRAFSSSLLDPPAMSFNRFCSVSSTTALWRVMGVQWGEWVPARCAIFSHWICTSHLHDVAQSELEPAVGSLRCTASFPAAEGSLDVAATSCRTS